jgi:hypothetical protein
VGPVSGVPISRHISARSGPPIKVYFVWIAHLAIRAEWIARRLEISQSGPAICQVGIVNRNQQPREKQFPALAEIV